jgi:hypothetical protein
MRERPPASPRLQRRSGLCLPALRQNAKGCLGEMMGHPSQHLAQARDLKNRTAKTTTISIATISAIVLSGIGLRRLGSVRDRGWSLGKESCRTQKCGETNGLLHFLFSPVAERLRGPAPGENGRYIVEGWPSSSRLSSHTLSLSARKDGHTCAS